MTQESNLHQLVKTKAFNFTDTFFPYTSGKIGPYFIQSASVTADPNAYNIAIKSMADKIKEEGLEFDVITGGETRDWVFSYPLAITLNKPHRSLYKNGKHFGADIKGKKVLHVADLNNEGSSPRDSWIPQIKEAGGEISSILFYVDRCEAGVQVIEEELGLNRYSVIDLDKDAWTYLRDHPDAGVTDEIYQNLTERQKNPEQWAENMLRSEEGFTQLVTYLQDEKTRAKAEKIIEGPYQHIGRELKAQLESEGIYSLRR